MATSRLYYRELVGEDGFSFSGRISELEDRCFFIVHEASEDGAEP